MTPTPREFLARERDRRPAMRDAIDVLESVAARASSDDDGRQDVRTHAESLRANLNALEQTQDALADALIASQDRLDAIKALTCTHLHVAASEHTIAHLLETSLPLTRASVALLLDHGEVTTAVGDQGQIARCASLARSAIAFAPTDTLATVANDTGILVTVDPMGVPQKRAAFFRPAEQPFGTVDIPVVEAVGAALGAALASLELHARELHQATIEREHQLASALAQSVISAALPTTSPIGLFARTQPASLAGGDFYVFGALDGATWFAVGDVAGKGLPAAMLMTRAVSTCQVSFLARRSATVEEVFKQIEDELYVHLDDAGMFLTIVVGRIDGVGREVTVMNAGHSPVLIIREGEAIPMPATAPPLGVVRNRHPIATKFQLPEPDALVVGSDGLVERRTAEGHLLGYDRFSQFCAVLHGGTANDIGRDIFNFVGAFAVDAPADDDATLVVIGGREG